MIPLAPLTDHAHSVPYVRNWQSCTYGMLLLLAGQAMLEQLRGRPAGSDMRLHDVVLYIPSLISDGIMLA